MYLFVVCVVSVLVVADPIVNSRVLYNVGPRPRSWSCLRCCRVLCTHLQQQQQQQAASRRRRLMSAYLFVICSDVSKLVAATNSYLLVWSCTLVLVVIKVFSLCATTNQPQQQRQQAASFETETPVYLSVCLMVALLMMDLERRLLLWRHWRQSIQVNKKVAWAGRGFRAGVSQLSDSKRE